MNMRLTHHIIHDFIIDFDFENLFPLESQYEYNNILLYLILYNIIFALCSLLLYGQVRSIYQKIYQLY